MRQDPFDFNELVGLDDEDLDRVFRDRSALRASSSLSSVSKGGLTPPISSELVSSPYAQRFDPVTRMRNANQILDTERSMAERDRLRKAPYLSAFIERDPLKGSALSDSLEPFSEIEIENLTFRPRERGNNFLVEVAGEVGDIPRGLSAGFAQLIGSGVSGAGQFMISARSDEDFFQNITQRFLSLRFGEEGAQNIVSGVSEGFADTEVGQVVANINESQTVEILNNIGDFITIMQGGGAQVAGEAVKGAADYFRPDEAGFEDQIYEGIGQIGGAVLVSWATGGSASSTLLFGGMGVDMQADRMRRAGVDPNDNLGPLLAGGGATLVTERLRLGRILNTIPPRMRNSILARALEGRVGGTVARSAGEAIEESLQEGVEGALHGLIETTYNENVDIFDGMAREMGVAAASSFLFQAAFEAVIPGRNRMARTEQAVNILNEIRDRVEKAPATSRARQTVAEYVDEATDGKTIMLSADGVDTLYQMDGGTEILADIGVTEEDIARARRSGEDVEVSVGMITTSPQYDVISEHIRISSEDVTVAQAKMNAVNDVLSIDVRQAAQEVADRVKEEESGEVIAAAVERQLVKAGRSVDEGRAAGVIWSSVMRGLANRTGQSPTDVFQNIALKISDQSTVTGLSPDDQFNQTLQDPRFTRAFSGAQEGAQAALNLFLKEDTAVDEALTERLVSALPDDVEVSQTTAESGATIVQLSRPLQPFEIADLSMSLGQAAVSQLTNEGTGVTFTGEGGAPFDPTTFIVPGGQTLADISIEGLAEEMLAPYLDENGMLPITHYGKEVYDEVDVSQQGKGLDLTTRSIRERKAAGGFVERAYFGVGVGQEGGYRKERNLGDTILRGTVDPNKTYPIGVDPMGFKRQANAEFPTDPQRAISRLEELIKEAGYSGYFNKTRFGYVYASFENVPVDEVFEQNGLELFDERLVPPKSGSGKNGRVLLSDIGKAMTDLQLKVVGKKLYPEQSEEDYQSILQWGEDELTEQLRREHSGVGWYDDNTAEAIRLTSKLFPTLATNKDHRDLFVTFAGIFSNGLTPDQAWSVSAEAFELFLANGEQLVTTRQTVDGDPVGINKETGKPIGWTPRNNQNVPHLEFVKFLMEREGSLRGAMDWLSSRHPRSEIDQTMVDAGLHKKGRYVTKAKLSGPDDFGFFAFGPKLGPYSMSLFGGDITARETVIDMWYTRTYRRWTGRLLDPPVGKEGIAAQPTDRERETYFRLTNDLAIKFNLEPRDVQAVLWFFEKRLWTAQGAPTDEGTNLAGAEKLLEKRGISPDDGGRSAGQALEDTFFEDTLFQPEGGQVDGQGRRGPRQPSGGDATGEVSTPIRAAEEALEGATKVQGQAFGPIPEVVGVAEKYAADNGITFRRQAEFVEVDEELAGRIADAYEAMEHRPDDPDVREAYQNMILQTELQYDALVDAGYEFYFVDVNTPEGQEYLSSPWNAMRDLRDNKRMGIYPTDDGYGTGEFDVSGSPMLAKTGIEWVVGSSGQTMPVYANDLFRAVHDVFGHGIEGSGFRARGEENAWQAHVRLFTGTAVKAITSETRGQNSWLNYGPHGDNNRTAKIEDTVFADQKVGLMPEFTWTENRSPDMPHSPFVAAAKQPAGTNSEAFRRWFGDSKVVDENGDPLVVYHGTTADFEAFQVSDLGGIWMTPEPGLANLYAGRRDGAQVMPVYASIQNPLIIDEPGFWEVAKANTLAALSTFGQGRARRRREVRRRLDEGGREQLRTGMVIDAELRQRLEDGGHDGIINRRSMEVVVLDPAQIKSVNNRGTYDPNDPAILRSGVSGDVNLARIRGKGDSPTLVRLYESANTTTFMHESAHIFLELYAQLEGKGYEEVDSIMQDVREWLGLEPGQRLERVHHELFAESFETYLLKGKPPSRELKSAFAQFRKWFLNLFRSERHRFRKLDDRAISIFDRMLDAEASLQQQHAQVPMTASDAVQELFTEAEAKKVDALRKRAREQAADRVTRLIAEKIQRANRRDVREQLAALRSRIKEEVEADPTFQLIEDITNNGEPQLDRDAVVAIIGEDDAKRLPRGKRGMLTDDGGVTDLEALAEERGFNSAESMVQRLVGSNGMRAEIRQRVQEQATTINAELMSEAEVEDAAQSAVLTNARSEIMKAEIDALARRAAMKGLPLAAIKRQAKLDIETNPMSDVIKPGKYNSSSRTLYRRAQSLAAKGEWGDAMMTMQQALLQHEKARLAYMARDEVQRGRRRVAKFSPTARSRIKENRYLPAAIEPIFKLFSLAGGERTAEMSNEVTAYVRESEAPVILPPEVSLGQGLPSVKNMTLEQFRAWRDALNQLGKFARDRKSEEDGEEKQFRLDVSQSVEDNAGTKHARQENEQEAKGIKHHALNFVASLRRMTYLARVMDGGPDVTGAVYKAIIEPLRRASNAAVQMKNANQDWFLKFFEQYSEPLGFNKMLHSKTLGRDISGEQVFAILANVGNESNRARLLSMPRRATNVATSQNGELFFPDGEKQLQAFIDEFGTPQRMEAVQSVWDYVNSYWPRIADLQRRMTGVAPTKVEAEPVVAQGQTYRGGYYPLAYDATDARSDPQRVGTAGDQSNARAYEEAKVKSGVFVAASTKQGHTEARANGVKRLIDLRFDVVTQHLDNVAHDLAFREPFTRIWGLVTSAEFRTAATNAIGDANYKAFKTMVQRTVAGQNVPQSFMSRMIRTLRVRATTALLGVNVSVIATQPLALTQSYAKLGTKNMTAALGEYVLSPIETVEWIRERSEFMRNRERIMTRDIKEMLRENQKNTATDRIRSGSMWLMQKVDVYGAAAPTWLAAYRMKIDEGWTDEQASLFADTMVADIMGSGDDMDLSQIQSGDEVEKMFSFMYGYFSGTFNLTFEAGQNIAQGKVAKGVSSLFLIHIVQGALANLIMNGLPDDDDEDGDIMDDYLKAVALGTFENMVGSVPLGREMFSALQFGRGQSTSYGSFVEQVARLLSRGYDTGADFFEDGRVEEEKLARLGIDALRVGGLATGLPTYQVARVIDASVIDESPSAYEIFVSGRDRGDD